MSALVWWLIPIGATVLALLFVFLRGRTPEQAPPRDSLESMRRMQQAMERPMPGDTRSGDTRHGDDKPGETNPSAPSSEAP